MVNVKKMGDRELVYEWAVLRKEHEKLTNQFNTLPKKEREEGSAKSLENLILLGAVQERLLPISREFQMRLHANPDNFSFLQDMDIEGV